MFELIWDIIKGIFKLGFFVGVMVIVIIVIGVLYIKSLLGYILIQVVTECHRSYIKCHGMSRNVTDHLFSKLQNYDMIKMGKANAGKIRRAHFVFMRLDRIIVESGNISHEAVPRLSRVLPSIVPRLSLTVLACPQVYLMYTSCLPQVYPVRALPFGEAHDIIIIDKLNTLK